MSADRAKPTVLFLTGTCGVGKTTTARAWAEARRGANVVGDDIRWWMREKATRHANGYQWRACTEIAVTVAEQFVKLGLDVALDYVWTPPMLRIAVARLEPIATVRVVWLQCERAENRRRDAGRAANVVMGDRVDGLRAELEAFDDWPVDLKRIDNTGLTLEQVLTLLG